MVNLSDMPGIVLIFVVIVFVLGVGATMLTDLQEQQCEDVAGTFTNGVCSVETSIAVNSTISGLEGIETISDWTPTIGLVIVIGLVIAILIGSLGFALGFGRGGRRA